MINLGTILTEIKKYIGLQYISNGVVTLLGTNDRLVNFVHPLITPESLSATAELTLPQYKGDWASGSYIANDIVKYNDLFYKTTTNTTATPGTSPWALYDAWTTNITKEFDIKIKNILSEIYSGIKNSGQTQDVIHNGIVFLKGNFNLKNTVQIIKLVPRTGTVLLNTLKLKSKELANASINIYDLEDFESVFSDTAIVNTFESVSIAKESLHGFVIRIESDQDLFFWDYHYYTDHLNITTRSDADLTDVEQFRDDYYSLPSEFCCEIDVKIYCDLTDFFVDNIEILIPYITLKLAHSYVKSIFFNGAARSNKYEANERVKNAEMDIYGDKMNVGSLIHEITEMEKNLISKFGYGNPCLKKKESRIKYESM